MSIGAVSPEQEKVARNRVETVARAMFAIKGLGEPDMRALLPIIDTAMSRLTTNEVRHPDDITVASIGDIQGLVTATQKKAFNIYGADAPAAGKGGLGADDKLSAKGIDLIERLRNGSGMSRYRDSGEGSGSGGSTDGSRGASSRIGGDYQTLDLSSPQSLQHLSGVGWGSTAASLPFARAGLNFGTVKDLRTYDRNFTGQDVLKAAGDVKQLGFAVNDKRAMRNHATIRHYDNNADATNDAERKFKHSVDNDNDLQQLLRRRGLCKDPVQAKALDAQIDEHTKQHLGESGLQRRMDDPQNHPKAKAAIKDDVDHILHRNQGDLKVERKASLGAAAARDDGALQAAHRTEEPVTAKLENKTMAAGRAQSVASVGASVTDAFGVDATPVGNNPPVGSPTKSVKVADAKLEPGKPTPVKSAEAKAPASAPKLTS